MTTLPYTLDKDDPNTAPLGLIVLQADETIEPDFHRYFADNPNPMYVTRVPSGQKLTHSTIKDMEKALVNSAELLPKGLNYSVVGYGCTSASAIIGSEEVERLVQRSCNTATVTNPLRATAVLCAERGISRLALVSPYVEEISAPLRNAFAQNGVEMPVFGSFGESEESNVVRISQESLMNAALKLGGDSNVEGVFLSCTNLRTFGLLQRLESHLGKPVFFKQSGLVMAHETTIGKISDGTG